MSDAPIASDPADMTLDELAIFLAPSIADSAIFDGWGKEALEIAAQQNDVDADVARLAFPGGAIDMIFAWIDAIDQQMERELSSEVLADFKIRDRIKALVQFRLDAVAGQEEALRRATAIMAMPQNAPRAIKRGWHTADIMWRLAGDTATDYNHYTKRAILSSIYSATLAVFVNDEGDDKAATRAFLDRRIDGVMKFEKAKARLLGSDRERFSVSRFLGRLRYPAH